MSFVLTVIDTITRSISIELIITTIVTAIIGGLVTIYLQGYFQSTEIEVDFTGSRSYLKLAKRTYRDAQRGCSYSQYTLGKMYLDGNGLLQDYVKAERWLRMSSQNITGGNKTDSRLSCWSELALYTLGCMYQDGIGVFQNDVQAIELFREASRLGCKLSQDELYRRELSW